MQPRIKVPQLFLYLVIFVAAPSLTFTIGSWLDQSLGLPVFPVFPLNLFLGMGVMITGLNLGIKSTRQLYSEGLGLPWGEAVKDVETQRLVVDGLYAYSRNPMVLGYSLLPVGMGLMFQSPGMVLSLTPLVLILNFIIVKAREEPMLLERFGEEYRDYRERTPFLFPNWVQLMQGYLVKFIRDSWGQLSHILMAEISLLVTSLFVFQDHPYVYFTEQALVSSLIFAVICVLGIVAGLAPSWCYFGSRSERRGGDGVAGHHPDCGRFTGHTVSLGGRVYCAGCSGLVLGAVFSLVGLVSGFYPFDAIVGFWLGVLLVGLGLAQHLIDLGSGWVHLMLNFWFVIGAWLMFGAIQLMELSFLVSAYFLIVTVFWVYIRISTSRWTHLGVCKGCEKTCKHRFS
jgi:protein-S-isoprenylcysteine O-methyltransferase Ste14